MLSFVLCILLFGGFYDFSVSLTAICILAEIMWHYYKKKPVYNKKRNYFLWIPAVMVIWSAIVSFWAIDASENALGVMRGIVILLWMYRCFLMEEEEKQKILCLIPFLGAGMVLVSLMSSALGDFGKHFWQARRLGGFFQYSNTCALFFLLGIVILVQSLQEKSETGKYKWARRITFILLIVGILLTGSRSILLLALLWGVYRAVMVKSLRIPFAAVSVISLAGAYLYGVAAGDVQNIARIFTLVSANSTIWGRVLYYIDALSMACKYPFGLGYMGYYYVQPAMQTGVYTTRFVHNDFLQLLVDYGCIAWVAGIVYLLYQLVKGKQGKQKKEVLILVLAASLVDFHLQYLSIVMLLGLCLELGEKTTVKKQKTLRENYIFCAVALVVAVYFTIAFGAFYNGNNELTLAFLPSYTQAQIKQLSTCQDKNEAELLADEILSHNEYVSDAYHSMVYVSVMDGDFENVVKYMDRALAIRRYDAETYQVYDELLTEMIIVCDDTGQNQSEEMLKVFKAELPVRLMKIKEETHPIAFKLRDVPVFEW